MTESSDTIPSTIGAHRWPPAAFVVTIAGLAAVAVFFHTGPVASDDTLYLEIAQSWDPGGPRPLAAQFYARPVIWVSIRLASWLLGDSWRALMWPPLVAAVVAMISVAVIGRRWFGDRAALLAVIALGLTTHFIVGATIALPDIFAAAFVAAALAVAGPAVVEHGCRQALLRAAVGGFLIGLGYSAKEPVALVGVAIGTFMVLQRFRQGWAWKRFCLVALGSALWLVTESLILWKYTGDWLYHVHAVRDSQAGYGAPTLEPGLAGLLDHWTQYVRWLVHPGYMFAWWGPCYVAAGCFALVRSNGATRLLVCVLLCIGLYLSVGSSDWSQYTPLWHQPRYLIPLFPVGALLIGYAANWLLDRHRLIAYATRGAIALMVVASLHRANQSAGTWYAAREFQAGRVLVADAALLREWQGRIFASGHTRYRLRHLFEECGLGSIEHVGAAPETAVDWMTEFGGRLIVVSGPDRKPPDCYQRRGLLSPEAVESLQIFPKLVTGAPSTSPLRSLLTTLGMAPAKADEANRIDVYAIPETEGLARQ